MGVLLGDSGVVHTTIGQATGNRDHLKMAQQCFQLVGTSAHECDTIPGRQCMASCYFLMRQFEDVNIYLNSIKVTLLLSSPVCGLVFVSD